MARRTSKAESDNKAEVLEEVVEAPAPTAEEIAVVNAQVENLNIEGEAQQLKAVEAEKAARAKIEEEAKTELFSEEYLQQLYKLSLDSAKVSDDFLVRKQKEAGLYSPLGSQIRALFMARGVTGVDKPGEFALKEYAKKIAEEDQESRKKISDVLKQDTNYYSEAGLEGIEEDIEESDQKIKQLEEQYSDYETGSNKSRTDALFGKMREEKNNQKLRVLKAAYDIAKTKNPDSDLAIPSEEDLKEAWNTKNPLEKQIEI